MPKKSTMYIVPILLIFLCWAIVFIGLLLITTFFSDDLEEAIEKGKNYESEEYKAFKNDTEVIKGNVTEAKKEGYLITPDKYNLVVKTKDNNSKLINVNEQTYRNYQKGSNVHFRIDKTDHNTIVRDLENESDIDTIKAYKKYSEKEKSLSDFFDEIFKIR